MKPFYKATTQFLTRRGFRSAKDLTPDDELFYFVGGKLKSTKDYSVITKEVDMGLYTIGGGYVVGTPEIVDLVKSNNKQDKPIVDKVPKVKFLVNDVAGSLSLDSALVYRFLFQSYFSINVDSCELTYSSQEHTEMFNKTVYGALDNLGKELKKNNDLGYMPFIVTSKGKTSFKSDYFAKYPKCLYGDVLDNFSLTYNLVCVLCGLGLIFVDRKDSRKTLFMCFSSEVSKLVLFLLSTLGRSCYSIATKDSNKDIKDFYNLVVAYQAKDEKPVDNKERFIAELGCNIKLPEDGTLIASYTFRGKTSMFYMPSLKED